MPSNKQAEYNRLTIWVHNECNHYHPNGGWATIRREPDVCFQEQGYKCERPESGQVFFLFAHSSSVLESDLITWGEGSGRTDDRWVVVEINRTNQYLRCEVRRPKSYDQSVEQLLRSAQFIHAADYLCNARERLRENSAAGWNDCVANCRNALQEVLTQLTGEKQLSAGIAKIRDICNIGDKETVYVESLEKLFRASRDVLSKSGAHPPMPQQPFATFALELTSATIRFLLTTRK